MRDTLKPLLARVMAVHPSLSAHATMNGIAGDSFQRVQYVVLESRSDGYEREMFSDMGTHGLYRDPSVIAQEIALAGSFPDDPQGQADFFEFLTHCIGGEPDDGEESDEDYP